MTEELKLRECPFCRNDVQMRQALWPHDGNVDAIIHDHPTDCGLLTFSIGRTDEGVSTAAAWNRRAPSPELTQLVKAARIALGRMTGGMDGYWPAGVNEVELLREALVPFKEVE